MPHSADIPEPSRDSIANLNTRILHNQRILSSQNALVSKQVKKVVLFDDDDKGSNYNENENDDEMESLSDSCDDDDAHTHNAQTVSCAQSLLPLSSPPTYKSDDSTHPVGDIVHPHQEGGLIYTRLQKKGKGRAIDAEDIDAANHSDHDTQLPNLKKLGNLSTAALDEICAFVKDIKMTAEELGWQCRRSTCDILVTAGFSVKASHTKINEANLFCSWYWATQPKPDGGIPKDDFMARREKLKAIYEWTRVDNAKTQFSGLAEVWSNLEDIEIVGAVMYVGQDPAGHQTSGVFGGSEMIRNFINENGIDVWSLMDKYTAIFKCLRNSDSVDARVAGTGSTGDVGSVLELHCHTKETPRDHNCRVFGSTMKEKMLAALRDLCVTHGIKVSNPQKVSWYQLLQFLWRSHLTIVNWPHGVSPPGPGFKYKKLKAGPLCKLMIRKNKIVWMMCWKLGLSAGTKVFPILFIQLDADPLKGEITLIKSTDGTVLQQISDDPEWQKSLKETDHQQQGIEDSWGDHMNYHDPGASNIPYHVLPSGHHTQFPLSCQGFHCILSRTNHPYYNGPYTDDYYPPTQLGEPHWVNRGNAAQYEDDFTEEYINEDYY
ncbi:hypothetical protein F5J12DRAFT_782131 [Pisolithus orientalis]|uniref:uncharacterized protein n=1 Tax=Pisolithus orientalis TaxID=936130 RepID=UPI0022256631|nr:uncharacterized protein F5J12DRAFT_782131 [Pisolithus orientalis]KAI6009633.1 hypothetical protein F5J12DRAFT_782131 [Pisolithus orientalis]